MKATLSAAFFQKSRKLLHLGQHPNKPSTITFTGGNRTFALLWGGSKNGYQATQSTGSRGSRPPMSTSLTALVRAAMITAAIRDGLIPLEKPNEPH